jgi:Protein of unknown function (DUF4238)
MLDHILRQGMAKPERFAAFLAAKNKLAPRAAEQLAKQAKVSYLAGRIRIEVKPELSLVHIFEHCDVYAEAMANWNWEVVSSPTPDFITGDCPVHFADKRHVALLDPETQLHFPLTSKALLIMRFAEPEQERWGKLSSIIPDAYLSGFIVWHNHVNRRAAENGEVDELNGITASMADTTIYVGSETNAFEAILSEPSQNVQLKVTASGEGLRIDLQ